MTDIDDFSTCCHRWRYGIPIWEREGERERLMPVLYRRITINAKYRNNGIKQIFCYFVIHFSEKNSWIITVYPLDYWYAVKFKDIATLRYLRLSTSAVLSYTTCNHSYCCVINSRYINTDMQWRCFNFIQILCRWIVSRTIIYCIFHGSQDDRKKKHYLYSHIVSIFFFFYSIGSREIKFVKLWYQ